MDLEVIHTPGHHQLDIKLFRVARGKAIALYERLGFVRTQMPGYLTSEEGVTSIYMELIRK